MLACGESKLIEEIEGLEKVGEEVSENFDGGTCTNVIISDRYALTAAHCFETTGQL